MSGTDRPIISVVIPTYNRAAFICRAVDSALGQTYAPLEVVVVDDGSKDDTREVLRKYGDRIRYVAKENGGVSSARNVGVREATGEYIAFLDSDDTWVPEKLAVQMDIFRAHPDYGMVLSECAQVTAEGKSSIAE